MKALNFDFALVCDDIRQERNGKYIIIGMYSASISTQQFPLDISISYLIQATPTVLGEHTFDVRLIKDDNIVLLNGQFGIEVKVLDSTIIPLHNLPIQIQSEGMLRLQFRGRDNGDWMTIKEIPVVQRTTSHRETAPTA